VRVGIPSLRESGSLALQGKLGDIFFSSFVCVAPLRLRGIRGKKSTPNVGWEVPVRSQRLASGSKESPAAEEHQQSIRRLQYLCFKLHL
jgi:hypothetical protein